jgi:hypothetical protein
MTQYYVVRLELVRQYFESAILELQRSAEKLKPALTRVLAIRCKDVHGLLNGWLNASGDVDVRNLRYKLGIDHWQKFLKLTVQVFDCNSVRSLAILWAAQVPETFENLRQIFMSPAIRQFVENYQISMTMDLKAACLVFGIMSGRHSCLWCTWDERDNLDDCGKWELRGDVQHMRMYDKWIANGGIQTQCKDYKGVQSPSVFNETSLAVVNNMHILNPPELHLMLGCDQKLYDTVLKSMSESDILEHKAALLKCGIRRSDYHGNAFEGNQMRQVLKRLGDLRLNEFCSAYTTMVRLVEGVFGVAIDPEFETIVWEFEEAWRMGGLSCTTKMHVVCRHVIPFIKTHLPAGKGQIGRAHV